MNARLEKWHQYQCKSQKPYRRNTPQNQAWESFSWFASTICETRPHHQRQSHRRFHLRPAKTHERIHHQTSQRILKQYQERKKVTHRLELQNETEQKKNPTQGSKDDDVDDFFLDDDDGDDNDDDHDSAGSPACNISCIKSSDTRAPFCSSISAHSALPL